MDVPKSVNKIKALAIDYNMPFKMEENYSANAHNSNLAGKAWKWFETSYLTVINALLWDPNALSMVMYAQSK